jgi:myo-inositol-1-phosphate synthase
MMVGWGGNNGSTVTAGILANRKGLNWLTKEGAVDSNYYGSMVRSSTVKIGQDKEGHDTFVPFYSLLPMVNPNDIVLGGWDICGADLASAMDRAQVLEPDLKRQVYEEMKEMKPLPSIYSAHFIAENQRERANNLIPGPKKDQLAKLRQDIR